MTEGGIRIASVPEAATRPAEVGLSKPVSCRRGRAKSASNTTEAPTIPEDAARRIPMTRTDIPMPAALPPSARWAALSDRSATPEVSRIKPMKMNIGMATKSQFDRTLA